MNIEAGLERLGYRAFRMGQRQAIETLLAEDRLLLVAPTGGGKSLVYQLPAVVLPGTALVISPLISLMADQVEALKERGISATYLAATLEPDELRGRMSAIARGEFDLVYAAPERLAFTGFRSMLKGLDCPLIAIDEAHCISEWGHDFRPEYLEIGKLLEDFPQSRVLACTATATPVVRDEIIERLGLPAETPQLIYGFARPNLSLRVREVQQKRERERCIDAALEEALGRPGSGRGAAILYCPTRKIAEVQADRIRAHGWKCMAYHAGKTGARREQVHRAFSSGELEIVAATNAFGMGIDRADVRAVIHFSPPGSIEAYYQEVGRAGRDGADALALMIVSPGDMARRRALLEMDMAEHGSAQHIMEHKWGMFLELMRFAEGGSCRHDAVLRYFGDEAETLAGCGRCDVCEALSAGAGDEAALDRDLAVPGDQGAHPRPRDTGERRDRRWPDSAGQPRPQVGSDGIPHPDQLPARRGRDGGEQDRSIRHARDRSRQGRRARKGMRLHRPPDRGLEAFPAHFRGRQPEELDRPDRRVHPVDHQQRDRVRPRAERL
ncbi:MAG: RecQ family ATP-dependent DNA helicase, partial [Myxococcales bacterium]|nr:RecQ family ATP-dependent DNA helicase [Myxococcales bacterium]